MYMFASITSKLIAVTDAVLCRIGDLVLPICDLIQGFKADFLVAFAVIVVMFALGIILCKFHLKEAGKFYDRFVDLAVKIPGGIFYAIIVMRVFYPLIVAWFGLQLGLDNFFGFGEGMSFSFYNFSEWAGRDQALVVIAMLQFLLTSAICVIRLKPGHLLRYWVYTIDFALIGYVVSALILLLYRIIGGFFLGQLLILAIYYILYVGLSWIFILVAFAPAYAMIAFILSPIIGLVNGFNFNIEFDNGEVYKCNFLLLLTDMMLP